MSLDKKQTIKDILLDIDARIAHIEDMTADHRAVIMKLVKQGNSIVKFLKDLDLEAVNDVEISYEPVKPSIPDLPLSTTTDEKSISIKELIDEYMDRSKALHDLEEELRKNKDDITPGQVGEA